MALPSTFETASGVAGLWADLLNVGSRTVPVVQAVGWVTLNGVKMPDGALTDTRVQRAEISATWTPDILPGAGTPILGRVISVSAIVTPPTAAVSVDRSATVVYANMNVQVNGNTNSVSGSYSAMAYNVNRNAGGTAPVTEIYGIKGDVQINLAAATTSSVASAYLIAGYDLGTVTNGRGLYVIQSVDGGTVTNLTGVDIQRGSTTGAVTTTIGLRITAWSGVAVTTDIAIQSLGGQNRFVGQTIVGANANPVAGSILQITGASNLGLYVTTTVTGELGTAALWSPAILPSANRGAMFAFYAQPQVAPNSFTIGNVTMFYLRGYHPASTGAITSEYGFWIDANVYDAGSIKPATVIGLVISNIGSAGVTTAVGISLAKPTGATNNYYMSFDTANTTAPAAGFTGWIDVQIAGVNRKIPYL